jgi:hypothetical protein
MINIISCTTTIDNSGRTQRCGTAKTILNELKEENWSDDSIFQDTTGTLYFIDDLLGLTFKVCGETTITLIES